MDFSYEVSRSLAACEGALLVVDAGQGVEAQSVANCYTAIEQGLEVLPVLNKMDLPQAEPERVAREIEDIIGIDATQACRVSAKSGIGIDELLEELVRVIPPPKGDPEAPLQALIIDSWFDTYLGVVSLVRVMNGTLRKRDRIVTKSIGAPTRWTRSACSRPSACSASRCPAGEVGFVVAGIKDIHGAPVGDTITHLKTADSAPALPGFKQVKPQVYAGLFTVNSEDYEDFRDALAKLTLNDASLFYEPETSDALGFGFRCGFLGMLHMEIVQERLEREYDLDLITTAPDSDLRGAEARAARPSWSTTPRGCPIAGMIEEMREPIVARQHPGAAGLRGQRDQPVRREARRAEGHAVPRPPGLADLRDADGGSGAGLLRPPEIGEPRLRVRWTTASNDSRRPTWCGWTC